MKISYAITVYNELEEIKKLVGFLLSNKRKKDEDSDFNQPSSPPAHVNKEFTNQAGGKKDRKS